MVKITKEHWMVILLVLVVFGARMYFVFQEENLSYDAYYSLRQAEHIKQSGVPLFKDDLSYSGRTFITPPLFYYALAGVSFVFPLDIAAKLLPSIGFALLVLVIYLISKHITKNKVASFIAAFFSGFVPILFTTLNQVSVLSLSLPLIFLLSYTFLRIEEKGFATLSIVLSVILLLIHTSLFILLLAFLMYFLIITLEKHKILVKEAEVSLFLLFLALWFYILLYRKAFFTHGISFIWQNIPAHLLSNYFTELSFISVIYAVGLIPLLLGVYAVYHVFFKTRNKAASLYISFALISFIMLWFKLIPFKIGLLFLSMNLIILSAYAIKMLRISMSKAKISYLSKVGTALIIILFIITALTPFLSTLHPKTPPSQDIDALEWLKTNVKDDSVVLGRVEEGFLINYAAEKKNVADSNFLFMDNINQRYEDVNHLYTLRLKSEAVRLINKYEIDYIFLSTNTMDALHTDSLFYADKDCFETIYDKDAVIYEFKGCKIE
ncbi:MAG: hypothetical protein KKF46_08655 [Nanoarchaeota archaeon]|nr:hypothetical protein [Nanoarchaeota archaeon]MBU1322400.1 hypothetical protein [Nanoarchaeota archaeon]MBU1596925.1 hypothetical protein [Nanoarchaeota archaeon]MBU2442358.1 hypothetical protein [Nanoarchaeota archaeon]